MNKSMVALLLLAAAPVFAQQATPERQAEVARRGAQVMPFELAATTHLFTTTQNGGVQRVVAKDPSDARQTGLVRAHLRDIARQFKDGNFSAPARIHGDAMPGLARLKAAAPGQVQVEYREVDGGAELVYRSDDPQLVTALHEWFGAQLADHGKDAMSGHHHH
ncbi:aspartate carbamoyltransferase [Massilia solisilvae]|uniref:Aspartate carbamoyltransferase n=1 Tax=Massilia solisilvae TaxID=1811225 RepID=A0ABT2BFE3_9BURK|nr:aspartate carbamoyltransferase [Massilia solisilvae]MCS0607141.1 aspartate carbamoyltransferase [Massilia solisilvae]